MVQLKVEYRKLLKKSFIRFSLGGGEEEIFKKKK